jgi:hypothetical protein
MSERRDFITAPGEWTRVARQTADRVAYSYAIERPKKRHSSWTLADKIIALSCCAFVLWTAWQMCEGLKCVA